MRALVTVHYTITIPDIPLTISTSQVLRKYCTGNCMVLGPDNKPAKLGALG